MTRYGGRKSCHVKVIPADVALEIVLPLLEAMKPSTEKTANPDMKLVKQLMMGTIVPSLGNKTKIIIILNFGIISQSAYKITTSLKLLSVI